MIGWLWMLYHLRFVKNTDKSLWFYNKKRQKLITFKTVVLSFWIQYADHGWYVVSLDVYCKKIEKKKKNDNTLELFKRIKKRKA
jgi:hypothetical protein